ncbi:MAG: hypothetical protein ACRCVX_12585 [Shewanella sp.]
MKPIFRVKRRTVGKRKGWGVQIKRGWFWRWHGPYGDTKGCWESAADAIEFRLMCEQVVEREYT